jgi:hypothetical protein
MKQPDFSRRPDASLLAALDGLNAVIQRSATVFIKPAAWPNRIGSPTSPATGPQLDSDDVAALIYELTRCAR